MKRIRNKRKEDTDNEQTGQKAIGSRQIPRSFDECTVEDKELITLRDDGNDWQTIRQRWFDLTGESTGNSTLPNRYARLK